MKGALTADSVFATVLLARQASTALLLIVEGEDDNFIIKTHVNDRDVLLITGAGGKSHVLEAAALAERRGIRGLRFLVDADYDRFTRPTEAYPANVIASCRHDAVMDMLLEGTALVDRVIESHSRHTNRRLQRTLQASQIRQEACAVAAAVGTLRIVNERKNLELNLRDFPFGRLSQLPPSATELAAIALSRSPSQHVTAPVLAAQLITEQSHVGADSDRLIGDHDFFRALSRVLADYGVSASADQLWTAVLSGVLCAHLGVTDWYGELATWGRANDRNTFQCPCAA